MLRNTKIVIMALSLSFSAIALGETSFPLLQYDKMHRHLAVQLGNYWVNQGLAQHIPIETLEGNQYTVVRHHHASNGVVGLAYYVQGPDKPNVQLYYGVNGFYLAPTSVNGVILVEKNFANLDYSYKIQHIPVYVTTKAVINPEHSHYNIVVDAGVGPNFMQSFAYKEIPKIEESIAQNNYMDNTRVTFSAMAGLGMRLNHVIGEAPLECAYHFLYLGQGQLKTNNNLYQNALSTGNVVANTVTCSIII